MRVAPASIAFEIGVLFTTPPSISRCPPTGTGGSTPGIEALAMIASSASPVGERDLAARRHLGRDDAERDRRVLEPLEAQVAGRRRARSPSGRHE